MGTAVGLIVTAGFYFYAMIGEINGRSAPNDQIGMLVVNARLFQILRRHKELFPGSSKRSWMMALAFAGIIIWIGSLAVSAAHFS